MSNGDTISPWSPDTKVSNLRVLGKTAEEAGELSAILARCIIQGIDESEPVTGKPNRLALMEEMADVAATTYLLAQHFGLDETFINARAEAKVARLRRWFDMMGDQ